MVKSSDDPSAEFLRDMRPFFYGRAITYVDAGAYKGRVLEELLATKLRVHDAYLFEPNPESFRALSARSGEFSGVPNLKVFERALGSGEGAAGFVSSGTMSRVVPSGQGSGVVQTTTLDHAMKQEGVSEISILKIDVEGSELQVIEGARGLLAASAVDVIYIEAGVSGSDGQQVHHHRIEKVLAEFGYAMFRVYEQVNEWRIDSPVLRRVNLAFMSAPFAATHPLAVTEELFRTKSRVRKLKRELASAFEQSRSAVEGLESAMESNRDLSARVAQSKARVEALELGLRDEKENRAVVGQEMAKLKDEKSRVEIENQVLSARLDLHQGEAESLSARLLEAEKSIAIMTRMLDRESLKNSGLTKDVAALARYKAYASNLEASVAQITASTSWKLTRPVRVLAALISGALGRPRNPEITLPVAPAEHATKSGKQGRAANEKDIAVVEWARRKLLALGLTDEALKRLRGFTDQTSRPLRRRLASRELVSWYVSHAPQEERIRALEFVPGMLEGLGGRQSARRGFIMAAEAFRVNGELQAARAHLRKVPQKELSHPDVLLAQSNVAELAEQRIEYINRALAWAGLEPVRLRGEGRTPYDRLACDPAIPGEAADGRPTVTVIVPAYNCSETIGTALDSLLAQTWAALEVIVVDDCSSDGTLAYLQSYEAADNRVRILSTGSNSGPYVARNVALTVARGDFVTCHDADDWAHPRKVEIQVRHLMENPAAIANMAVQARADEELVFNQRGKIGEFVFDNISSLMFRREPVIAQLGCWDSVRFMADGEFIRRLNRAFGGSAVVSLPRALTCFQRYTSTSLTASAPFGFPGFLFGARREYFEASSYHQARTDSLLYPFPMSARPFSVPTPMRVECNARDIVRYDVVIASDFRLAGGSTLSSLEELKAMVAAGMRVGLLAMYRFDIDPSRHTFNEKLRGLINDGKVDVLVFGQNVECDLLIVRYPPVLQNIHRYIPKVRARHVRVIVNQPPMSDYGPKGVVRYSIPAAAAHLEAMFGHAGVWHPIGPAVRQALHEHHAEDLGSITLSEWDWVNIIDVGSWESAEARTRGPERKVPRIGRHARDHQVKWPGTSADLLTVYPDSDRYEVYVMGGADVPRRILGGRLPKNWTVIEFDGLDTREYLGGLDVFLYYTHPDWVESFGRVIIEAMAAGVPVVLPPSYRTLFGDAAIYAEPHTALEEVDRLMADSDYYRERVAVAIEYVDKTFGYAMHIERVRAAIADVDRAVADSSLADGEGGAR